MAFAVERICAFVHLQYGVRMFAPKRAPSHDQTCVQPLLGCIVLDAHSRACVRLRVHGLQEQEVQSRMRLIKFAGSLVEVQHQAFVCGSHWGCGASAPFVCAPLW